MHRLKARRSVENFSNNIVLLFFVLCNMASSTVTGEGDSELTELLNGYCSSLLPKLHGARGVSIFVVASRQHKVPEREEQEHRGHS